MLVAALLWRPKRRWWPTSLLLLFPQMQIFYRGWGRPGDTAFIAEDEGRPVGIVWYRFFTEASHGEGYVDEDTPEVVIAVVPDARGHGVGRALMTAIHDRARSDGVCRLSLSSNLKNPARRLAESFGYRELAEHEDDDRMVVELDRAKHANEFDDPRVAGVYDLFDSDRSDLDHYAAIVAELGASSVLDLGCGTGTLGITLARSGLDVAGADPAGAMLDVARAKPGADRVRWIHGEATAVPRELSFDVVTLTGNAAQAIVDDSDWRRTLEAVHRVLAPGGHFVFETRDPSMRAWESWTRDESFSVVDGIASWEEVMRVELPLVTFDSTTVFPDGTRVVATSTLRFRDRAEVEADLRTAGFTVVDVRDAPDRPGREFVFLARRV
jgi:ubiquinone/menaquinone biosynthesis C-methylase UbiE/GNAT superfamily N-acetyltransferase